MNVPDEPRTASPAFAVAFVLAVGLFAGLGALAVSESPRTRGNERFDVILASMGSKLAPPLQVSTLPP